MTRLEEGQGVLSKAQLESSKMIDRRFLTKNNYFYSQLFLLLFLNAFAWLMLCGNFFEHRLYWDNLKLFSFFRDNLHSLNYFGEIQWWNPHAATGFPIYYTSILGTNSITPLFVSLGAAFWLLGLFQVHVSSYHLLYVFYFGFIIPFLLCFALLLLSRQIFTKPATLFFIVLIASFSPGVLYSLSDNGLEQTTYGIFFATAYLSFQKKPTRNSFFALLLAWLILAVSFNHQSLFWNVIFIPLFLIVCNLFNEESFSKSLRNMIRSVPKWYWLAALIMTVCCILPTLVVFSQGGDIVRTTLGERTYSYAGLGAGNPLEILASATPGIGFEWRNGAFQPLHYYSTPTGHLGYVYLGMLVLPLSFIGLIAGYSVWRTRLFWLLTFSSLVMTLSGWSPIFSSILIWSSPLRAVNHFNDTVFRHGIFFLLILSAGLGVEVILRESVAFWNRVLLACFAISAIGSTWLFYSVYYLAFFPTIIFQTSMFGFGLMMIFFYLITLIWMALEQNYQRRQTIFIFLLCLTLIDISTAAFWHARNVFWKHSQPYTEPAINSIGIEDSELSYYANNLLALRQVKELENKGLSFSKWPVWALFEGAQSLAIDDARSLFLPEKYRKDDLFKSFFQENPDRNNSIGSIKVVRQTYNHLQLKVVTQKKAILFWRDAYFPYGWSASVKHKKTEIAKAFGIFKAIVVPAGTSEVEFQFSPQFVPYTLLLAYTIILAVTACWTISGLSISRKPIAVKN